ncbi:MAG: glycosyltransferase [Bacteroidota bacterium]|nr:glycosyltransferase [Bacteroidota bacterium]MDW8136889.1 glycosyltransferase [Bacteroidota bacterium]
MRIALIGPAYPYRGGLVHFQEALYRALQARGHEPLLVSFRRQYPDFLFPGRTQYDRPRSDALPGVRLIDTLAPWTWFEASRWICAQGAQVAVFRYWMPFFAPAFGVMARLLRRHKLRVLAIVDNALPHERHPGDRQLSRFFLRSCEAFVFMSRTVAEDVRRLGLERPSCLVPHPAYTLFGDPIAQEEARSRLGLPESAPLWLFFGYVRPYKGLGVLLEAASRARRHIPELMGLVVGEFYEDPRPYKELARRLGLQEAVRFYPEYVPNEQVGLFFSAADLVVLPYLEATQSGVGLIALHFERPLLATAVGGLPELVEPDKGMLVPPADAEAMAAAMVRFFRELGPAYFGQALREAKRRHSWEQLAQAIEALSQPCAMSCPPSY